MVLITCSATNQLCLLSWFGPGFGIPNRRRRVFLLASMHGDARDVLLAQVQGLGG
jgi:hypothetical protein